MSLIKEDPLYEESFSMLSEGLDLKIGQFERVATDIFVSPFFSLEFCKYLITEMERAGPHEVHPDHSSVCLLHKLQDGEQLCLDYADILRQYVEPVIDQLWTSAAKGRTYGEIPIPFIKRITKTNISQTVALHNDHRLFTMFVRLNADYEGADTSYPRQNFSLKSCPVGHLALMPGGVTHPHCAGELKSGRKYTFVGSFSPLIPREGSIDDIYRFFSLTRGQS